MRPFNALPGVLLASLLLASQLPTVRAAIVIEGDVHPADAGDWTFTTTAYIGKAGYGTVEINGGSDLRSLSGHVGYGSGSTGEVTVDGAGSTWTNGSLNVGRSGSGTLDITGGGAVSSTYGYIASSSGSAGAVRVDGASSTWTSSYLHVGYCGSGTLDITGGGAVTVTNSCAYIGTFPGSTGAVTVDGAGSTWSISEYVYVGNQGSGILNITGGAAVSNAYGFLGNSSGTTGAVTVDGAGSTWTSDYLFVGDSGSGTLNISGGATVNNPYHACIGHSPGSMGTVTVDGAGSTWSNSEYLDVGFGGTGTLYITGGPTATARSVSIKSQSLLAIDVGRGSSLAVDGGSGKIANKGTVRILAGAGAAPGNVCWPIVAGTWDGSGAYQAVGGTWDETSHAFIVSPVESGTSGVMKIFDLAQTQRLLISDGGTGWSVGAGFLAASVATELNFTATAIDGTTPGDLALLLAAGESVLSAWTFTVTGDGYTAGDPVYLSFDVGGGLARSDLNVWRYDAAQWSEYAAAGLTYDGQYASFAVPGFSGYAVSAVPEPDTLALLITAALGLLIHARWRRS